MLILASLRIAVRPQSRTAQLLGQAGRANGSPVPSPVARTEAWRVGRAVERIAPTLLWHPLCLTQAVAVAWMLRRRGIECQAHLGVTEAKPRIAHAWVTVGGEIVQGAPIDHVTELAVFV